MTVNELRHHVVHYLTHHNSLLDKKWIVDAIEGIDELASKLFEEAEDTKFLTWTWLRV